MEDLLSLSHGPMPYVTRFKVHIVNGYRFHVKEYDQYLKTPNSGVVVVGETGEEPNHMNYYGEVAEVIELQFIGEEELFYSDACDLMCMIKEGS